MAGLYPGHPFECWLNAAPLGLAGVFRFPVRRKLRPGSRASRANRTAKPMLAAEVPLGTPRLFHTLTTRALSPAPLSVVSPALFARLQRLEDEENLDWLGALPS
jgi:hypothetical protein